MPLNAATLAISAKFRWMINRICMEAYSTSLEATYTLCGPTVTTAPDTHPHMYTRVPIVWPWCGLECCVCSECVQLEAKAAGGEEGKWRINKRRRQRKGNAIYTAEIWKEGRSGDETEANENESSGEVCQQTQTWAARLNMENVTCFSSARGLLFGVAYVGVSVSCCVLALEVVHHLT